MLLCVLQVQRGHEQVPHHCPHQGGPGTAASIHCCWLQKSAWYTWWHESLTTWCLMYLTTRGLDNMKSKHTGQTQSWRNWTPDHKRSWQHEVQTHRADSLDVTKLTYSPDSWNLDSRLSDVPEDLRPWHYYALSHLTDSSDVAVGACCPDILEAWQHLVFLSLERWAYSDVLFFIFFYMHGLYMVNCYSVLESAVVC